LQIGFHAGTFLQILGHCLKKINFASNAESVQPVSQFEPDYLKYFDWGKGGKVTSAGWQVTLCDPIWHMISHSGVVISITNCYISVTLLYFKYVLLLLKAIKGILSSDIDLDKPVIQTNFKV